MDFLDKKPSQLRDQDLTPLINIIFLILIFFMLAAAIAPADTAEIEPVLSSNGGAIPDSASVDMTIDGAGLVYVDGQHVDSSDLTQQLLKLGHSEANVRLSLKADAGLDASVLISLLSQASDAGIQSVALMTIRR